MIVLKILGIIVLIFILISLISVGVSVNYEGGELTLSAYVCGILIQLLPKKKKEKKETDQKKKKEPDQETKKEKKTKH